MSHTGGYYYNEKYDLNKFFVRGKKMPNEDEPTCSLECEEEREARDLQNKNNIESNSKTNDKDDRIKEILTFLRNQGYTSLDLLDELELLINAKLHKEK